MNRVNNTKYALVPRMHVNIQRSDGRFQMAAVKTLQWVSNTVLVQWLEKGHAFGKNVGLDFVVALNPHVAFKTGETQTRNNGEEIAKSNPVVSVTSHTGQSSDGDHNRPRSNTLRNPASSSASANVTKKSTLPARKNTAAAETRPTHSEGSEEDFMLFVIKQMENGLYETEAIAKLFMEQRNDNAPPIPLDVLSRKVASKINYLNRPDTSIRLSLGLSP